MTLRLEEFNWSFMGAVIVISLACFALIVSVVYYCWLYEVASSFKLSFLSLCGVEPKKSGRRKDRLILPVSAREDPQYPNINRINSENIECPVLQRVAQRPKQSNNHMLRRSHSNQNGNNRPSTATRQTRQRAVNIAIHELKSHSHDQRENPPTKPAKSEVVKAYIKSAGASTSSVVDCYSSTTITDDMMSSESESESESEQRRTRDARDEVAGLYYTDNKFVVDQGPLETHTPETEKMEPESHRSRKWSKINRKLEEKENRFTKVAEQLVNKPGRSARAVAPSALQGSEEPSSPDTQLHLRQIVERTSTWRPTALGSIFEVLQSLRRSGNLGTNPVHRPVSRLINPDPINNVDGKMQHCETSKQSGKQKLPNDIIEDSSASDEIKSSTDSDTESSLIVMSSSPNFKPSLTTSKTNHPTRETEPSCDTTAQQNSIDDAHNPVESPSDEPEMGASCNADLDTDLGSQSIDPSKQVFGRENQVTPDHDKRESLVRRIDSLFCSTTPSSLGSYVSDNVFEEQINHNIKNINDLGYCKDHSSDQQISSTNKSSDDDLIVTGGQKISDTFVAKSNIVELPQGVPKISVVTDSANHLEADTGIVDQPLGSSSSSFNSTTLPSVSSDNNATSSGTVELSSDETDTPSPGKLKYFQ